MRNYLTPMIQVLNLNVNDCIRTSGDLTGKDVQDWFDGGVQA